MLDYPTLLDMPAPQIQAYPMETAVAEKLEAMVHLGMLNSRMKDFFDVWFLARTFPFETRALAAAVRATFARRRTALDLEKFGALFDELSAGAAKGVQWRAFLRKNRLAGPDDFAAVNDAIRQLYKRAFMDAAGRTL